MLFQSAFFYYISQFFQCYAPQLGGGQIGGALHCGFNAGCNVNSRYTHNCANCNMGKSLGKLDLKQPKRSRLRFDMMIRVPVRSEQQRSPAGKERAVPPGPESDRLKNPNRECLVSDRSASD